VEVNRAGNIEFTHTGRLDNTATLRTNQQRTSSVTTTSTMVPFTHANDNGVLVIVANGVTHRLNIGESVILTRSGTSTITFVETNRAGNIQFTHTNLQGNTATMRTVLGRAIDVRASSTLVPFTHAVDDGVLVIIANGVEHRLTAGQSITLTN
jgi:hypothetical protein